MLTSNVAAKCNDGQGLRNITSVRDYGYHQALKRTRPVQPTWYRCIARNGYLLCYNNCIYQRNTLHPLSTSRMVLQIRKDSTDTKYIVFNIKIEATQTTQAAQVFLGALALIDHTRYSRIYICAICNLSKAFLPFFRVTESEIEREQQQCRLNRAGWKDPNSSITPVVYDIQGHPKLCNYGGAYTQIQAQGRRSGTASWVCCTYMFRA